MPVVRGRNAHRVNVTACQQVLIIVVIFATLEVTGCLLRANMFFNPFPSLFAPVGIHIAYRHRFRILQAHEMIQQSLVLLTHTDEAHPDAIIG